MKHAAFLTFAGALLSLNVFAEPMKESVHCGTAFKRFVLEGSDKMMFKGITVRDGSKIILEAKDKKENLEIDCDSMPDENSGKQGHWGFKKADPVPTSAHTPNEVYNGPPEVALIGWLNDLVNLDKDGSILVYNESQAFVKTKITLPGIGNGIDIEDEGQRFRVMCMGRGIQLSVRNSRGDLETVFESPHFKEVAEVSYTAAIGGCAPQQYSVNLPKASIEKVKTPAGIDKDNSTGTGRLQ